MGNTLLNVTYRDNVISNTELRKNTELHFSTRSSVLDAIYLTLHPQTSPSISTRNYVILRELWIFVFRG